MKKEGAYVIIKFKFCDYTIKINSVFSGSDEKQNNVEKLWAQKDSSISERC